MPPKKQAQKGGKKEENLDDILKQMKELDKKKQPAAKPQQAAPAPAPAAEAQATPADAASQSATPVPQNKDSSSAPAADQSQAPAPKKPKVPKEQTWPEPTVPVAKLFPNDSFPVGELMNHPLDCNTHRSSSAELKQRERSFEKEYKLARRAAECHRTVRKYLKSFVKPGLKMFDICERTENKIRELMESDDLKGGIAFPMGCSLDHVAAHYTPNKGDDTLLSQDSVVKFDIGIHYQGRIMDSAFSMCWNPKFQPLLAAVTAATNAGIKTAGVDVRLCDVGEAIQEVMESHEVELDGKTYTVKSVRNLCGHSLDRYHIHAGKTVPIVGPKDYGREDTTKMEENEFYAIETFGSIRGVGEIHEEGECSHYMIDFDAAKNLSRYPVKNAKAKDLLKTIYTKFGTLAWCRRYLDRIGEQKYMLNLRSLVQSGIVNEYPPLVDSKGSYVAQFEHTLCLKPTVKEVFTRGDDY